MNLPLLIYLGMLIESMAGKSGAMHGEFQDSSPFRFHEQRKIVDYMGEQLRYLNYILSYKHQYDTSY